MSPTCKLKTFHEYKALTSFEFANKDNQESFLKITHALCKRKIRFFWKFSFRKGKVSSYWIIIFLCRVMKMKFYWFISTFIFFLKDKKLKKLGVALKFLYFLIVLSLNSTVFASLFACTDHSLYKSSKRRNYHEPKNSETLFLLSALKMPVKSVTTTTFIIFWDFLMF